MKKEKFRAGKSSLICGHPAVVFEVSDKVYGKYYVEAAAKWFHASWSLDGCFGENEGDGALTLIPNCYEETYSFHGVNWMRNKEMVVFPNFPPGDGRYFLDLFFQKKLDGEWKLTIERMK